MERGTRALSFVAAIAMTVELGACASYRGSARDADPAEVTRGDGWLRAEGVPLVKQENNRDCGAAALAAVLDFWGHPSNPEGIEAAVGSKDPDGLRAAELRAYAQKQGLRGFVVYGTAADLEHELRAGRPAIVGVAKPFDDERRRLHYEVVVGLEPRQKRVLTLDPARGFRENSLSGFESEWAPTGRVLLVIFPEARADASRASRAPRPSSALASVPSHRASPPE